ncbi:hypothetical protein, partial [Streptomyces sp. SID3343]|uniref:hypothetical protein n=1 Tax=Streptomyces sp. SID3343 TaxID=2690260 RepID=UPI00136C38DD
DTLREAEAAGHTTAALAAAGAVLALAPQRLAALQREQVRLADERDRLDAAALALDDERGDLDDRDAHVGDLRAAANATATRSERARAASDRL